VSGARPGRVLRRSLLAWGLGHLDLGARRAGLALLAAEGVAALFLAVLTVALAPGSLYLLPYLLGIIVLVCWALQALAAYRLARARVPPAPDGGPPRRAEAASIAWLGLPLLAWGTSYWLFAGVAATPAAVVDRFAGTWARLVVQPESAASLGRDPDGLARDAAAALESLDALCREGTLRTGCEAGPEALLHDVRFRIRGDGDRATAVAELVRFERRSTRFLGIFEGAEWVPIPERAVLELQLTAEPGPGLLGVELGDRRWSIAASRPAD
jgi:hypothetical protein